MKASPCTVINTQQINSCETDEAGATIKGQVAEELLSDPSRLCSEVLSLWNKKTNQTALIRPWRVSHRKIFYFDKRGHLSHFSHC